MLATEEVFKLLYYTAIRVALSKTGKWDEMPCVQAFMSLHNKDSGFKGNT